MEFQKENNIKTQEGKKMVKYRCLVCGYIHEGELTEDFKCPRCKQPASVFVLVEEKEESVNRYAGTKTEKNLMEAFSEGQGDRSLVPLSAQYEHTVAIIKNCLLALT
ncbi:MAG: hypothetical protein PHI24_13670 [Desulfitobacteriaceae bacterium]|nr:hypothetical protein [Desulfitobacteriaceae bacterium]